MNRIGKIYRFAEPIFIDNTMQVDNKEMLEYGDKQFLEFREYNDVSKSTSSQPQCFKGTLKGIVKENGKIFVIMDLFGVDEYVWKGTRYLLKIPMNNNKLVRCKRY